MKGFWLGKGDVFRKWVCFVFLYFRLNNEIVLNK